MQHPTLPQGAQMPARAVKSGDLPVVASKPDGPRRTALMPVIGDHAQQAARHRYRYAGDSPSELPSEMPEGSPAYLYLSITAKAIPAPAGDYGASARATGYRAGQSKDAWMHRAYTQARSRLTSRSSSAASRWSRATGS